MSTRGCERAKQIPTIQTCTTRGLSENRWLKDASVN